MARFRASPVTLDGTQTAILFQPEAAMRESGTKASMVSLRSILVPFQLDATHQDGVGAGLADVATRARTEQGPARVAAPDDDADDGHKTFL